MVDIDKINILNQSDVTIGNKIAEGGEGEVFLGTYKQKEVIIKKNIKEMIEVKEIEAYCKIKHKNIVEYYGYFLDKDNKMNIVLEKAEGTELKDLIEDQDCDEDTDEVIYTDEFSKNHRVIIMEQIADLLQYFKINHIIHRDIKPSNIFVNIVDKDNVIVKVLDFGIVKMSEKTMMTKSTNGTGTLLYQPYESFTSMKISYKFDVFSFGLTISYMFSDILPWNNTKQLVLEFNLMSKKPYPVPKILSESNDEFMRNIAIIVKQCTQVDPEKRPNPTGLKLLIEKLKEGGCIVVDEILKSEHYN